ncbi:kinase-like protein, partial [Ramaria rubella]
MTTSSDVGGSIRWMSPELFRGEKVSKSSDVWAYGMTVLEVVTERRPYHDIAMDPVVLHHILDGCIPLRPPSSVITDGLWRVCERCWSQEPTKRASMPEITQAIMAEQCLI